MTVKISSSKNREIMARYWPHIVAAVMAAYVVALCVVVNADIARTAALLRAK